MIHRRQQSSNQVYPQRRTAPSRWPKLWSVTESHGSRPGLGILRWGFSVSLGLALLLLLVIGTAGEAKETVPSLPPPVGAKRLDPQKPVWVDVAGGRVAVDGHVCLRRGVLEMFACPAGTKEHESVVAVDSPAFLLHTALLAAGAEPGHPAKFDPAFQPPAGPEILVTLEWNDATGKTQTASAQSWIRNVDTGKEMAYPFVFGGSGFWTDPDTGHQHYLADAGDLICVSNFGTAMLDVPIVSSQSNRSLLFEPFTEHIPPINTPVRVWLTLKKTEK